MAFWSHGLEKSRDKLKSLYHHHHSVYGSLGTWSSEIMWQFKNITTTMLILCKVVTYCDGLTPLISHDLSIKWSCEFPWQIKYFMSLLALDQWPPNMARLWLTLRSFHPSILMNLYTRCGVKICYKLKHFSTIRMHMIAELVWVVTCREVLPPINLREPSMR